MTTNPFLVEPFRFPSVHGRVGGDGGGNGGGRGGGDGGGEGPVPSPKRIRSPVPKPMPAFSKFDVNGDITLDEFSSIVAWQLQLLANGLGSRKSLVAEP